VSVYQKYIGNEKSNTLNLSRQVMYIIRFKVASKIEATPYIYKPILSLRNRITWLPFAP
jgi:hypothetical protein